MFLLCCANFSFSASFLLQLFNCISAVSIHSDNKTFLLLFIPFFAVCDHFILLLSVFNSANMNSLCFFVLDLAFQLHLSHFSAIFSFYFLLFDNKLLNSLHLSFLCVKIYQH